MKSKQKQSYESHTRYHPIQHFVLLPLSLLALIVALIYTIMAIIKGEYSLSVFLLLALVIMGIITGFIARINALAVQDRVIRIEEQFRYFVLTNKQMDARLTVPQLIALRFASDEEFPELAVKAAENSMNPAAIKKEIQKWRSDNHRV